VLAARPHVLAWRLVDRLLVIEQWANSWPTVPKRKSSKRCKAAEWAGNMMQRPETSFLKRWLAVGGRFINSAFLAR